MIRKDAHEETIEIDLEELLSAPAQIVQPELLEQHCRLNNREIVIDDCIDEYGIDPAMYIQKWNKEDAGIPVEERKPITIWINSDGGDLATTLFTANVIALSKTPVVTIGMNKIYSSGGLLLMAGHRRLIFETTTLLIHDGSCGMIGDTGKVFDNLEFMREMERKANSYMLSHTKIPAELLESQYRKDWFMFSDDIIKYGVADEIITDLDDIA